MSESNPTEPRDATTEHLSAREVYTANLDECAERILQLAGKNRQLAFIRMILFPTAAICLLFGYFGDSYHGLLQAIGWLSAVAFFIALILHEHLRLEDLRQKSNQKLFRLLVARLDREWNEVPEQNLLPQFQDLSFADDLDVAGPASLLGLLSLANTYPGNECLQRWLASAPDWKTLVSRQNAIKQLAAMRPWRIKFLKTVRAAGSSVHEPYGLPRWAETPNWLVAHPGARILSYIGPAIVLTSISGVVVGAQFEDRTVTTISAIGLGMGFLINILVTVFWGSWIHDIFQKVSGEHRGVYQFASVFEMMSELPSASGNRTHYKDLLAEIRERATESPSNAKLGFSRLLTLVRLANLQKDLVLYLVYLSMQLVFLYDFRVLRLLEAWKARFGPHVKGWFDSLGTCEALVSGATLADEYPNWAYAEEAKSQDFYLSAVEAGHPLLPDSARVSNSLELKKDRPLVVVTGSNMAGKSTFLRATGLNMILSRAGAPCCADKFCMARFDLATSIRVRDSLSDGVSFFMAELKRLKEVVDQSSDYAQKQLLDPAAPQIFFLLDEILQGTNSQERQIAVATVLQQLLQSKATGFISTHDLDLADAPEVKDVSQIVHFREFFESVDGKEVMRFDYRMRPGTTPTTNALKLLKLVGLDP